MPVYLGFMGAIMLIELLDSIIPHVFLLFVYGYHISIIIEYIAKALSGLCRLFQWMGAILK